MDSHLDRLVATVYGFRVIGRHFAIRRFGGYRMNRAIAALLASAFAFVSASALAADGDTTRPPLPKKQAEDSWLWSTGDFAPKRGWADKNARKEAAAKERAAKRQAEIDAKQKAGAANKPTKEERQKHLTEQSKKGSGQ